MQSLKLSNLIRRLEKKNSKQYPGSDCLTCRDLDNYQACTLPEGRWCESGWHFFVARTPFGYDAVTAFEICPLAEKGIRERARAEVLRRREEKRKALVSKMADDLEVAEEAQRELRRRRR